MAFCRQARANRGGPTGMRRLLMVIEGAEMLALLGVYHKMGSRRLVGISEDQSVKIGELEQR